jgi:hypothetical protein
MKMRRKKMGEHSPEDTEKKKRAIFDGMGPRGRERVLKIGYEKWDPFEEPSDPIDIRKDKTNRTSQALIREFLQGVKDVEYSNDYGRGAWEICLGIINKEERFKGMYDFACWYQDLLSREGCN